MGHKLQLVYGDALLSNPVVKKLNKTIFDIMGLHLWKSCFTFQVIKLSNKRNQETRLVRAALSAYQAFYRNIPTFYNLLNREATAFTEEEDLQEIYIRIEELVDGNFLAMGIGICQLLDIYAKASLDSQFMSSFPTTVLASIIYVSHLIL